MTARFMVLVVKKMVVQACEVEVYVYATHTTLVGMEIYTRNEMNEVNSRIKASRIELSHQLSKTV